MLEKTDIEILKLFTKDVRIKYSISDISRIIKKPYSKVHNSIMRMSRDKIIFIKKMGRSSYCEFIYENNIQIAALIEKIKSVEFMKKNQDISVLIKNLFTQIKVPDYTILVFGSNAKGTATKKSDIDLMFISSDDKTKDKIRKIIESEISILPFDVHVVDFIYADLLSMFKDVDNKTVGSETIGAHILINGFEQYYECMRLAKIK